MLFPHGACKPNYVFTLEINLWLHLPLVELSHACCYLTTAAILAVLLMPLVPRISKHSMSSRIGKDNDRHHTNDDTERIV